MIEATKLGLLDYHSGCAHLIHVSRSLWGEGTCVFVVVRIEPSTTELHSCPLPQILPS